MRGTYSIQRFGRETVRYCADGFRLDMDCYRDPSDRSYTVIVGDSAVADGKPRHLTIDELSLVEARVKAFLEAPRLLGFPLPRRTVNVLRRQSVV